MASASDSTTADVIVLGMGPGGEQVATDALAGGLTVIGIEAELVGGECPYWGCIPSKMAIRGATVLQESRRIEALSGTAQQQPDWSLVAARIRSEATDNWDDQVAVDRFLGNGGTFVRGYGKLTGPRTVVVGEIEYTATRALVIGAGTKASIPPIAGLAEVPYWTNREALRTETVPTSLVVLGGGAIGCELAQTFSRFGSSVTVVEAAPRLIAHEEPEAAVALLSAFEREGITVITGVGASKVSVADHEGLPGVRVDLADGTAVCAAVVLVATGRRTELTKFNSAAIGIDPTQSRALRTNDFLEVVDDSGSTVPGVYAVGDVAGKGAFTHVAVAQGRMIADQLLGRRTASWSSRSVGHVTFTDPEVGAVGLTEHDARTAGLNVVTASYPMASTTRGWIHGEGNDGLFKLIVDHARGVIVGGTVVGPHAGEVLAGLTVAVAGGVPVQRLIETVWAYPTYHRGFDAVLAELPDDLRSGR